MNKQELKTICDDLAIKVNSELKTKEQISKNILKYCTEGKISSAGIAMYCITESQEFTKKLVYSVLCEALDL